MAQKRSVEASEVVLSSELLDAGALLLDIRTNSRLTPDQEGWKVTAWPTCSEATITTSKVRSDYVDFAAPFEHQFGEVSRIGGSSESPEDLRVRQGKTAIRRFGRHNGLTELPTFTYAEVPPLRLVDGHIERFWKKWKVATGKLIPPYMWVPEWGKKEGRLHIHMGVNFWCELNCTEVCAECDRFEVLKKFPRSLSGDELCIGCLWGHGFVGRPESNSDGRGLAGYLAKYIAKDLGAIGFDPHSGRKLEREGVPFGGHRYHLSRGHKPTPVRVWARDLCVAQVCAMDVAGAGRAPDFSMVIEASNSNFGHMEYHDFSGGGEIGNVQSL